MLGGAVSHPFKEQTWSMQQEVALCMCASQQEGGKHETGEEKRLSREDYS